MVTKDPLKHLPCSTLREYRKGELIYDHDRPSTCLYLVLDGHVKVCRIASNGNPVVLDIYRPDEFFGELALLGPSQGGCERAVAMVTTKAMVWTIDHVEEIVGRCPELALALLQVFARRVLDFSQRIDRMIVDSSARRLAWSLLRLSERLGRETGDGRVQVMPFTHELLAEYVGTSREIITHYMNEFRRRGHLQYSRKGILLSPQGLRDWMGSQPLAATAKVSAASCG